MNENFHKILILKGVCKVSNKLNDGLKEKNVSNLVENKFLRIQNFSSLHKLSAELRIYLFRIDVLLKRIWK